MPLVRSCHMILVTREYRTKLLLGNRQRTNSWNWNTYMG
jgi:hypothetical protein